MVINHNLPALNTYNKLILNNTGMSKSLEKLSSGLRINRAADDAAGLAISEKMRAQISGLNQASRNAQDGISMIQTAEGALQETHSILQRMRELSVQAANDTYTSSDRQEIQKEVDQLVSEVDRIAGSTQFNGKYLLNGDASAYTSTDKLTTKVFMRDGLRVLDQFGQKAAGGGNYKLDITATAGKNQIQKTDIFKIKHATEVTTTAISSSEFCNGRYAKMCITMDCGCTVANCITDSCATLQITFDFGNSCTYTLCQVGLDGFGGVALATAMASDTYLSGKFCVAGCVGCLSIESKTAGQDFSISYTITVGACSCDGGQFLMGVATACDTVGETTACTATTNNACYGTVTDNGVLTYQATKNVTAVTMNSCMLQGNYSITTVRCMEAGCTALVATACFGGFYSCTGQNMISTISNINTCATANLSTIFRVVSVCQGSCTAMVQFMTHKINQNGCNTDDTVWSVATCMTLGAANWINLGSSFGCIQLTFNQASSIKSSDLVVINQNATSTGGANTSSRITINCSSDSGTTYACIMDFTFDKARVDDNTVTLKFFQVDNLAGTYADASLTATTDTYLHSASNTAKFTVQQTTTTDSSSIGTIAGLNSRLYDVDKFWDASGNFILDNPQTITLVQGNGKKANIQISGADTFADVRDKLNAAIANDLGQSGVNGVGSDTDKFVSFVTDPCGSGPEALQGTFVIRSAMAGKEGNITILGNDNVLAALSLQTIQKAEENSFNVNVTEIHSGTVVASDVKISDNNLVGVVHQNVDVQFASNSGLVAKWDDTAKNFTITGGTNNACATFVHIADNTTVLQVGANQKQDIGTGIGNMGKFSLGIANVQVTSNALANDAIGKIDVAISRVSSERSKLGALQNRLDHTINNLTTTSENLTAAESRIRDVDMAKEMMTFTKYQILANAATSMLAQANQMPQSVLQLLR